MKFTPIFGVVGWKNSGKTELVTRLIAEFTKRGLKVSSVKHAHHNFDIDRPGADSFRHREAGAKEVALISERRWAIMHELGTEQEPPLASILSKLSPCDLILVEGYKQSDHPKIETRRLQSTDQTPLSPADPNIIAIAADHVVETQEVSQFRLDDIVAIADFINAHLDLKPTHD